MDNNTHNRDHWMRLATQEAVDAIARIPAMGKGDVDQLIEGAVAVICTVADEQDRTQLVEHCSKRFEVPVDQVLHVMGRQARAVLQRRANTPLPTIAPAEPSPFDTLPFK